MATATRARLAFGAGALVIAATVVAVRMSSKRAPPAPLIAGDLGPRDGAVDAEVDASEAPSKPRASVAHVTGTCTATFAPDGEAELFDEAIAAAVLDRFDPDAGTVTPLPPAADARDGEVAVADCRGASRVLSALRAPVRVVSRSLAAFAPVLAEGGIDSSVVARVIVGTQGGLCEEEAGFLALVSLRDRTIAVDAMAPWQSWACNGPNGAFDVIRWGSSVALLEEAGDGSGEQIMNEVAHDVWIRRGGALIKVGSIPIRATQNRGSGDERTQTKYEMTATLEPTARGVVAREKWTFARVKVDPETREMEPVPGKRPWDKIVAREYWIEGDELRREPEDGPSP